MQRLLPAGWLAVLSAAAAAAAVGDKRRCRLL